MYRMDTKPWLNHYDQGVLAQIDYPEIPVFAFLTEKAAKHPDQVCTIFKGQTISYQQMDNLTDNLAAALVKMGLKKGDRVALFLPNLPQFVLSFYGVLKAGGVVVAMNPTYKEVEVFYQLNDSGAEYVISLAPALPLFSALKTKTALKTIILTNPEDAVRLLAPVVTPSAEAGIVWLGSLLAENKGAPRPQVEVTQNDQAIFQYSGGTTGTPKAAIGLHRNLVANTLQFAYWMLPVRTDHDVMLAAIPLFHVFGMVIAMNSSIVIDASIVLIPNPRDMQDLMGSIEEYHVTLFPGVPNLFYGINQFLEGSPTKFDLSSLRLCISGSAPLPGHIKAKFEQSTGARLVEGYGLSEAPTACTCNPSVGENRVGSIGLPLSDVEVRIISLEDETTVVGIGDVGELVVRCPQIMAGYHNRPEESRQAIRNGWLYTGDVAYLDKDGYIYIVDRKKDVIKAGGLQVWPREVEDVIATHPKVLEVGVAGVMHPDYGETVKAWVVVKPNQALTAEEVIGWCKARLANFKAPRQVEFVPQLPRSTVGKVLRRELVRLNNEIE